VKVKLYSYWRSSCSWRVRIALAVKGIAFETVPVHLVENGGRQHADWFRELNPMSQVPVLEYEEDGEVRHVSQSIAILELLQEMVPEPSLLPEAPHMRARSRQLAEMINAGIQPLQNLAVLQRFDDRAEGKAWCAYWIRRGLERYEATIAGEESLCSVGDVPTFADLCLIPQLYNARRFGVDLAPFVRILSVERHCEELEVFRVAHPDCQPDSQPST
jgi:maleylpyruvate isomerase